MEIKSEKGEEYVITKHGKPVAEMIAIEKQTSKPLFGSMKGTVKILGDIISPMEVEWEANA